VKKDPTTLAIDLITKMDKADKGKKDIPVRHTLIDLRYMQVT